MRMILRWCTRGLVAAVALTGCAASASAGPQRLGDDDPPLFLPFAYPPDGSRMMGGSRSGEPGVTAPLVPPPAKPGPAPSRSRADVLDDLFHRLAAAADGDEATGLAARIQRLWLDSGSDTADLLMSRAASAAAKGNASLAESLLDKVVQLQPQWAEAWNKRANLRYLEDDVDGAMQDIGHVLTLEPRHFGALTGMAVILQRYGFKKEALAQLRRASVIYPHNDDLRQMIEKLTPEVEGRPI